MKQYNEYPVKKGKIMDNLYITKDTIKRDKFTRRATLLRRTTFKTFLTILSFDNHSNTIPTIFHQYFTLQRKKEGKSSFLLTRKKNLKKSKKNLKKKSKVKKTTV